MRGRIYTFMVSLAPKPIFFLVPNPGSPKEGDQEREEENGKRGKLRGSSRREVREKGDPGREKGKARRPDKENNTEEEEYSWRTAPTRLQTY